MQVTAIHNRNTNNYRKNSTKQATPAFKAVKGLGDTGENLLKIVAEFLKKAKGENSELFLKYLELESAYYDAVATGFEKQKYIVIENLKELRNQVLDFYSKTRIENSETLNRLNKAMEDKIEYVPVQGFGFGKIAGYDDIKTILNKEFISKIKQEREGQKVDIPGVFAFFGPRGNGKTTSTKAIAEETGCIIKDLRFGPFDKPETFLERFASVKEDAEAKFKQGGRSILFMDEFTKIFVRSKELSDKFVDLLKDCSDKFHCTFFGTTNHLSSVPESFVDLKPVLVAFEPPSKYNTIQVLRHYLQDSASKDLNYSKAADYISDFAKSKDSVITNSDLFGIAKIAKTFSKKVNESDIINAVEQRFKSEPLLSRERIAEFTKDYEKFMK